MALARIFFLALTRIHGEHAGERNNDEGTEKKDRGGIAVGNQVTDRKQQNAPLDRVPGNLQHAADLVIERCIAMDLGRILRQGTGHQRHQRNEQQHLRHHVC